jgi:hypothetical protein
METLILDTDTLPSVLANKIRSRRFRACDKGNSIAIIPLYDESKHSNKLRGMLKDEYFSLDAFLERKHADKELEI